MDACSTTRVSPSVRLTATALVTVMLTMGLTEAASALEGARPATAGPANVSSQNWWDFPRIPADSSTGNHVMAAQAVLNRYGFYAHGLPHTVASCSPGYADNVDGYYGACTRGAIRNFEQGHGFSITGTVSRAVWYWLQGNFQHQHETNADCAGDTARNFTYTCNLRDIYGGHHPRPYSQEVQWVSSGQYWRFYHVTRGCSHRIREDGPWWCQ